MNFRAITGATLIVAVVTIVYIFGTATQSLNLMSAPKRMKKHVMSIPRTDEEQAMMQERSIQLAQDPFSEWKTPIEFYGLVVDENNQPLAGAIATWTTTNMAGNGHGQVTSGFDGRFSIITVGKGMNVDIKKDGYRTVEKNQGYEFSAFYQEDYYDGDKDHPTIFHLKKIPNFESIYIWNKQIRDANHLIGSQLTLDPKTGQWIPGKGRSGISMQLAPGPDNVSGQARFKIILTTSGEGVLAASYSRDDQAPQSGYKNPADQKLSLDYNSQRIVEATVFFKDSIGNYGKLHIDLELLRQELSFSYRMRYDPNGGTSLSAPQGSQFQINK